MLAAGANSFSQYGLQCMADFLEMLRSVQVPTQAPIF
jgi:hypothetical protein